MKAGIKQKITDMIITKMNETGLAPWQNGFLNCHEAPVNYATGKKYQGVNAFLLRVFGVGSGEYVTYNQAKEKGGYVNKNEHGLPVIWYTLWNKTQKRVAESSDDNSDEVVPYLKYSTVFEISQCEGLESKREKVERKEKVEHIKELEQWLEKFMSQTKLKIEHNLGTARYTPSLHTIHIRSIEHFKSNSDYYSTLLHELVHSTGLALNRKMGDRFASHAYSKEEIIAEIGAMFLCEHFGIAKEQTDNSVAYIKVWSENLRKNPDWLISGISSAEKAFDYMMKMGI